MMEKFTDKNSQNEDTNDQLKLFKLVRLVNNADTLRDRDDIQEDELGFYSSLDSALEKMQEYVQKYFCEKDKKPSRLSNGDIFIKDSCSYAANLVIKEIKINQ